MPDGPLLRLSRRERQMMDVLYRKGQASAAEVQAGMEDAPSYSAVRATLRILEDKGAVTHEEKNGKYVYLPAVARDKARKSALRNLIDVFFDGSSAQAAAALLGSPATKFTQEEIDRLAGLIEKARKDSEA